MPFRAALLLGAMAVPAAAQSKPPLRLDLEHTIDVRSGVSFGQITWLDVGLDGSVAVVDEANGRIYRFLPGGKLRDSLGRRGQGPGEFLAAAGMALGPAGEVALADIRTRRLTFWAPDGRLLRSVALKGGLPVNLLWRGADPVVGAIVHGDSVIAAFSPVHFGSGESAGPWMGRFTDPAVSRYATAVSCGTCRHALATDGRLLVTAPDTFYRISEVDATGRVVRRWSRADVGAGLRTREEAAALRARVLAGPGAAGVNPERGARTTAPAAFTYRHRFQGIGMDARGRVLALVSNAGSERPVLDVFDGGGQFLGTIVPSHPLMAMVVRGTRLVALGESAEGEPVIHVYRIEEVP